MKNIIIATIASVAFIGASCMLGYHYYKAKKPSAAVAVTGLCEKPIVSDLIVWSGRFQRNASTTQEAYAMLKTDMEKINVYLQGKGITKELIVFGSVSIDKQYNNHYTSDGNYYQEFTGYQLSQDISIESNEVERVEQISREVTELIDQGIEFYSQSPRYYYTKLNELKIEMLAEASKDATLRAEKMATHAGSKLGSLRAADMGIFQITGSHSEEEYSWGGTLNTSSKNKTASITVKMQFDI